MWKLLLNCIEVAVASLQEGPREVLQEPGGVCERVLARRIFGYLELAMVPEIEQRERHGEERVTAHRLG